MKYAVIVSGGKQYRVSEGETVTVEKLEGKEGDKVVFEEVLLVVDGEKRWLGQPKVEGAKVSGVIKRQFKGEKIRILKFRAKSRYRRRKGHRQLLTEVEIKKIKLPSVKKAEGKKPKKSDTKRSKSM